MSPEPNAPLSTPLDEAEPPHVRWLKFAVVAMGIMIVVGLLVIIGRIVYLASNNPKQATGSANSSRIAPAANLAIPTGSIVRQISLSGDRLAIHYEGASGTGIAIMDLANGTVLSRVQVLPDLPR